MGYRQMFWDRMDNRLNLLDERLKQYWVRLKYLTPQSQIREKRQYLIDIESRMRQSMARQVEQARNSLELYAQRLKGLSPLDKLSQGFSYGMDADKKALVSISQVKTGDTITLQVSDGTVKAQVTEVWPVNWN